MNKPPKIKPPTQAQLVRTAAKELLASEKGKALAMLQRVHPQSIHWGATKTRAYLVATEQLARAVERQGCKYEELVEIEARLLAVPSLDIDSCAAYLATHDTEGEGVRKRHVKRLGESPELT